MSSFRNRKAERCAPRERTPNKSVAADAAERRWTDCSRSAL